MPNIPYRTDMPRESIEYTYEASCFIDPILVKDWDEYTLDEEDEFFVNGPIPCDGSFQPGLWCEDCRFGKVSVHDATS